MQGASHYSSLQQQDVCTQGELKGMQGHGNTEVAAVKEQLQNVLKDLEEARKGQVWARKELEELKKSQDRSSKKSYVKFTKYKAQSTAKIKQLKKQIKELKKVSKSSKVPVSGVFCKA